MADNFEILGVSEDANPEQIRGAFDEKRAELIASIEDDQKREESIDELQKAYEEIRKKNSLALLDEGIPQRKIDPLLGMVDNLNAPLHDESDQFASSICLHCGAKNPKESQICTTCGKQIARPCPRCGKLLRIDAAVCPRCNTILREYNQSRLIDSEHLNVVKESEREEDRIRVAALEEHHQERAAYGFVFWLIVIFVLICLCALTSFLITQLGLNS